MNTPPPIRIDRRTGSGELHPLFPPGSAVLDTLPYGDLCFEGNGPDPARRALIGVERKRLGDLLTCIKDGRYSGHQLAGLRATYDRVYLVVEGITRPAPSTGQLEESHSEKWFDGYTHGKAERWTAVYTGGRHDRGWMWQDVDHWITSQEQHTAVTVRHTATPRETVALVCSLRSYYEKPWDRHHAHEQLHERVAPGEAALLNRVPLVRRVARELDGIGWERSKAVADAFPSVAAMCGAVELAPQVAMVKEWTQVEGIGPVTARKAVRALRGEL